METKNIKIAGRDIPEAQARKLGLHPDQRATTNQRDRQMAILKLLGHENDASNVMGALRLARQRQTARG